ncbi:MAG: AAA family ATPase [Pseudomonadaceae bacterium]|nr:AAA family ATPase [Pseudomonadaceae bacterium]
MKVVLTGGPGSGKSTVLQVLRGAGYSVRHDAARHIIGERKQQGLPARPDPADFAREILEREIESFKAPDETPAEAPIFYERGVADAAAFLLAAGAHSLEAANELVGRYPYDKVFLFPPWEEIYVTDDERDHSFEHAVSVYESTRRWYLTHYPDLLEMPLADAGARAEYILDQLKA